MKVLMRGMTMTIMLSDVDDVEIKGWKVWLIFIIVSLSFASILFEIFNTYSNIDSFVHLSLVIIYAVLYSMGAIAVIVLWDVMMLYSYYGVKRAIYIGLVVNSPVVLAAILNFMMKFQIENFKVFTYFPEHGLIFGLYLLVFSNLRFISLRSRVKGVMTFILLSVGLYMVFGPIMSKLFKI